MKKITINMQSEQKYCIIELKGNLKENNTYWIEIDLLFPKSVLWFSEENVWIREQCYAKKENDKFSQINSIFYRIHSSNFEMWFLGLPFYVFKNNISK